VQEDRKRGQRSLFDGPDSDSGPSAQAALSLPDVPEPPEAEKLADEKKVLGFYMSSHPLARHAAMLQALATHKVAELGNTADKAEILLGGMITAVQLKTVQKSRSGLTRMAKLTFEDLTGSVPAMLWPEEFAKNESILKNDQIAFVKGTLDRRREPAELVITKIIPMDNGPAELTRGVIVRLHKGIQQPDDLERLNRTVKAYAGNLDLYLEILGLDGVRRAIFKAGPNQKVRHDERMLDDLESTVGCDNVRLLGLGGTASRKPSINPAPAYASTAQAMDDGPADDMDDD
jgi:DNA polymerase-3 subunit alpha